MVIQPTMTSCVNAGGAPIIIRATERKNFDSSVDFFFSLRRYLTALNFLQRYLNIILAHRDEYKECKSNAAKAAVAKKVVGLIKSEGGRFVQREQRENGRWFVLPERRAIEKVKQALRDNHTPSWVIPPQALPQPQAPPQPVVLWGRQFFPVPAPTIFL